MTAIIKTNHCACCVSEYYYKEKKKSLSFIKRKLIKFAPLLKQLCFSAETFVLFKALSFRQSTKESISNEKHKISSNPASNSWWTEINLSKNWNRNYSFHLANKTETQNNVYLIKKKSFNKSTLNTIIII